MRSLGRFASFLAALVLAASPVFAATPLVEDQRPAPGALIGSDYPSIFARFDGSSAIDAATVHVTLDGLDVTRGSTVSSSYVAYTPSTPLQNGRHTVMVTARAADGSAISSSWWFNVDEFGEPPQLFDQFGVPTLLFPSFGFFPPGFSLFVPGPLFFVSGNVIVVVLVSEFFPFGTGFCTIGGIPGIFPFFPWPNWPGHYVARIVVPSGAVASEATVAAHVTVPQLGNVVIHSAAPLSIDGTRTTLPPALHYAVLPATMPRPPVERVVRPVAMPRVLSPTRTTTPMRIVAPTRNVMPIRNVTPTRNVAPMRVVGPVQNPRVQEFPIAPGGLRAGAAGTGQMQRTVTEPRTVTQPLQFPMSWGALPARR